MPTVDSLRVEYQTRQPREASTDVRLWSLAVHPMSRTDILVYSLRLVLRRETFKSARACTRGTRGSSTGAERVRAYVSCAPIWSAVVSVCVSMLISCIGDGRSPVLC